MQFIIIIGNVIDGFRFVGPFRNSIEAIAYAKDAIFTPWQVTQIEAPNWLAAIDSGSTPTTDNADPHGIQRPTITFAKADMTIDEALAHNRLWGDK